MSGVFSFVRFFHRKEWALAIVVLFMIILEVWLDLEIPRYMASITEVITTGGTTQQVLDEAIPMILCAIGSMAVGLVISMTVGWI